MKSDALLTIYSLHDQDETTLKMRAIRNSCGICMGSYKNPKVLSCHHSFCSKCLDDYVREKLHDGQFDCPLCRTSVELLKEGMSDFQPNMNMESDFVGNFVCDLCGPNSLACRRCLDCDANLCLSCCHIHEKSKASRGHKISDLGTLDPKMKGKIRQRIFCDQHPEKVLELICKPCKLLICVLCKAVKHENHASDTIAEVAGAVKKTLQIKMNSCSEKLRAIAEFKRSGEALDIKINDAERKEIKALEHQQLKLIEVLNQEFAKMKDKIQSVYKDLMQQNAAFIRYMQDEFTKYSDANFNIRKLIEQGSDIDVIKKQGELEQLISTAGSKTYVTLDITLERDLFAPANIKATEITSLIGVMRESTTISIEEREKLEREKRENTLKEYIEKKEREDREIRERKEAEVKSLVEELSNTRKQLEETEADAITKGLKLTQAEKEIQALRDQNADALAQKEAEVKSLVEELSNTRKQLEETEADAITKGLKLMQAEKEIQALRDQHADALAQAERVTKAIETVQIEAARLKHQNHAMSDKYYKERMCRTCQGWLRGNEWLGSHCCHCGC